MKNTTMNYIYSIQISKSSKLNLFLILLLSIAMSLTANAQKKKKGYMQYKLDHSKESYESASIEKIKERYNYQVEIAWNKEWSLMRKKIGEEGEAYFLTDREEQNVNVYIHNFKTGEKFYVPIGDQFNDMLNTMVPAMKETTWTRTDHRKNIAGCDCQVYTYTVKAMPHDANEWCISEENKSPFHFHPFYQNQDFGLPLSMDVGSSIKLHYTSLGINKNISEELKIFSKEDYLEKPQAYLKEKNRSIYAALFSI